jgi:hypothetical protein
MIAHPPEKTSSEPRIDIVDDSGINRQYPEMKPQDIQQPPVGMPTGPNYTVIPNEHRQTGFVFPVLLIGAGVLLLLNTMDVIDWNVWGNIWRLWPLALVAVGLELLIGRRSALASAVIAGVLIVGLIAGFWLWASQPLSGQLSGATINQTMQGAKQANVSINFGVGTFRLDALAGSDQLISGQVSHYNNENVTQDFHVTGDTAYYTLKTESNWGFPFFNTGSGERACNVSLSPQVPVDLNVSTGVGESTLNLEQLNLTRFNLSTGAGATTVTLPARGTFNATINAGVGELNVNVPQGVGLRVTGSAGLGNRTLPPGYIETDKVFQSPGYASSDARIDLNINAGVGSINVREVQPLP